MRRAIGLCLLFLIVGTPYVYAHPRLLELKDGKYDFSYALFKGGLEDIAWDWPRVFASGKPATIDKETQKRNEFEQKTTEGRAIIIHPYVLTLLHYVDLRTVRGVMGPVTFEFTADEVIDEEYWLSQNKDLDTKIPLQKIIFLPESDLALFKMPENVTVSRPLFDFGRSRELRVGNVVFLLGSPGLVTPAVRSGIISGFGYQIDPRIFTFPSIWDVQDLIFISTGIVGGDSGSPVVALRDGRPELVGMVSSTFFNMGIMIAIDRALEKIKNSTRIDLRAVNEKNLKRFRKR